MAPSSEQKQSILVTGGGGFIGTHTVLQLLREGFRVTIIDNSVPEAVDRVRDLAGPALSRNLQFFLGDLRNKEDLEKVFSETRRSLIFNKYAPLSTKKKGGKYINK